MTIPAAIRRMVRAYEALGFSVTDRVRMPGALAMSCNDCPSEVVYIKTEQPFRGVSFKSKGDL